MPISYTKTLICTGRGSKSAISGSPKSLCCPPETPKKSKEKARKNPRKSEKNVRDMSGKNLVDFLAKCQANPRPMHQEIPQIFSKISGMIPGHTPRISKKIAGTHTQKKSEKMSGKCPGNVWQNSVALPEGCQKPTRRKVEKKKTQTQTEAKTRREDQESDKGKTTQVRR